MTSPGQTADELALMGAGWCAESLVLTRERVSDLTAKLAAAEAEREVLRRAAVKNNARARAAEAKLAKATAVVEVVLRKGIGNQDAEFRAALANYHAGPAETETPD